MAKLYVGNLPYKYNDEDLKNLFSSFGEVTSSVVIMDRMSGKSKGFGFVELSDQVAEQAIMEMNNKEVDGLSLKVSVAKPMEDRPRRDFNGGNRNGGFRGNSNRDNNRGGNYRSRY